VAIYGNSSRGAAVFLISVDYERGLRLFAIDKFVALELTVAHG